MVRVDAIYRNGTFQPLGQVSLPENQRVRLEVRSLDARTVSEWLRDARRLREDIANRNGPLPDSSTDIASDRSR